MTSLLKTGDHLETTVDTIAFGGDGVGRVEGLVVFVPYTAEGDRVRIRVTSVKKHFLRGQVESVLTPSPYRTIPQCRYYTLCGGCHYQHITYDFQLQIKKRQIAETLLKIGKITGIAVEDCIPSPCAYGYRGKAEFHAEISGTSGPVIGFMPARGSRTVDIDRCDIMDESINRAYSALRSRCRKETGTLTEDDLLFWSDSTAADAAGALPDPPGFPLIARPIKDRTFWVSRRGFFQANVHLVQRLVDAVLAECALTGTETVVDGFCGAGLFALFAAARCKKVIGVEIDQEAVRCAAFNARAFGCTNAEFHAGQTSDLLEQLKRQQTAVDLVILDPPRAGCDPEVLSGVIDLAPKRIVYVSCDPATQARDLRRFMDNGYRLDKVQPIDMFPQTKHIEVIATLRR